MPMDLKTDNTPSTDVFLFLLPTSNGFLIDMCQKNHSTGSASTHAFINT